MPLSVEETTSQEVPFVDGLEEGIPRGSFGRLIIGEGSVERAKRVALSVAWWLGVVGGGLILLPAILMLLVSSICAVVTGIVAGYFGMLSNQYDSLQKLVIHVFVPEPEPEPGYFENLINQATLVVKRIDSNLLSLLLVVIAILVSIWTISGFFYYHLRKIAMGFRGVQFEAMRPGSIFTPGPTPKCQVQIMIPGILMDSHQGYGIRVQNWLVVPLHVVNSIRDAILVGPRGKLMLTLQFEESRLHPDVAYIYLDHKQWVTLGTATASTSPSLNGYVRCTGVKGYSSGTLSKTRANGILKYMGSTVAGMSGAAYIQADKVLGMHTGASGDFNLGVSTTLFVSELKYKVKTEAAYLPSKNNGEDAAFVQAGNGSTWTAKLMDDLARDAALNTRVSGWDGDEIDFDEQIEWDAVDSKPKSKPVKIGSLLLENQGEDGGQTEMHLISTSLIETVRDMEQRLAQVEDYIQNQKAKQEKPKREELPLFVCEQCSARASSAFDLEQHKKKHLRFKCDLCETECKTELRLANHRAGMHPPTKMTLESVYPGDSRVVVETSKSDSFLGKRSTSPKRNKKTLKASSSSSESRRDSPPWETILNRMNASQKSIEKLCEVVLKGMGGQNLATQPK
uniref:C2H2-type domain-containing protein n=1 Tax=Riboviria sp. TaxID=2585031 RepID=A0A8K1U443_9VIRU|nr:MAG: hypothetical protein 2 [Riboviria sp.]